MLPRIAAVAYLNSLPLIWGMSRGRQKSSCDLTLAPPHECARMLHEGFVDVALIPSIEFARAPGLIALPDTGISSRREVRSVILVTRADPGSIATLAVDLNSRTSVALARLLLARRYGCRPRLTVMEPSLPAMLEHHDAALLIGDAALKASPTDLPSPGEVRVLDLAREWNEMTGLPFVFAFWACRPVVSTPAIREILNASYAAGIADLDRIVEEESRRAGISAELLSSYLRQSIHYRLGPDEAESLRIYFEMCREEGLLPQAGDRGAAIVHPEGIAGWPASSSAIVKSG